MRHWRLTTPRVGENSVTSTLQPLSFYFKKKFRNWHLIIPVTSALESDKNRILMHLKRILQFKLPKPESIE